MNAHGTEERREYCTHDQFTKSTPTSTGTNNI